MRHPETPIAGSLDAMVRRLAARGLLPCEHKISIWQHADNSGWGAAVETPYRAFQAEGHGEKIEAALEALMRETNRSADFPPNDPGSATGRPGADNNQ